MSLTRTIETLSVLGDENRLRLCALLSGRELNVSELVRVTGIAQSGVSTQLGRLREAGLVRDRREGRESFYTLVPDALPSALRQVLDDVGSSEDPTLAGDRERLRVLDVERGVGRDAYSPGRTWHSLATGIAALLDLGDVLDAGCGDGSAASLIAPRCRSLHCIDTHTRALEAARERFSSSPHVEVTLADAEALPFAAASFDTVLLLHTLTYTPHPAIALRECARVLRVGGRLVVLCLDKHRHHALTARHGERHAGFEPARVRSMLETAGLRVESAEVACREQKKPHLQVVLAIADKPRPRTKKKS